MRFHDVHLVARDLQHLLGYDGRALGSQAVFALEMNCREIAPSVTFSEEEVLKAGMLFEQAKA